MKQLISRVFPDGEGRLKIGGREFHYIAEVRREAEGSHLHIRLPDDVVLPFKIERIDRQRKELFLCVAGSSLEEEINLPCLILFQWILKSSAMDLVVRQAAEVGAELVVPVAGRRCVPQMRPGERIERWERIIKEARQQSGSAVNTSVAPVTAVGDVSQALADDGEMSVNLLLMLDEIEGSGKTLHERVLAAKKACAATGGGAGTFRAALAVGPEGGMTADERASLASCGFEGVHFNTNILRAETAALYGLAALQNAIMELDKWQLNA